MRRKLFLAGLALELALLLLIMVPQQILYYYGTPISLKTVPVDPRSIFRGDYVILSYEAGRMNTVDAGVWGTVFVVLEKEDDLYVRVGAPQKTMPVLQEGQVCIRGQMDYMRITFPDLAQYFVPEGEGLELESAQRTHRLVVDAVVNDRCDAMITGLRIGEEAPLDTEDDPFNPRF